MDKKNKKNNNLGDPANDKRQLGSRSDSEE